MTAEMPTPRQMRRRALADTCYLPQRVCGRTPRGDLMETIACLTTTPHPEHEWSREGYHAKYGPHHCPGITSVLEAPFRGDKPEIVVLCGSTRFFDEFRRQTLLLTLAGKIVLSIGCDTKSDGDLAEITGNFEATKEQLDQLHKRKIDLADRVLVLNVDGYLGQSTRSEIRYAWSVASKPVDFIWSMPDEHHDGRSHGICVHGEPRGACIGLNTYDIR